MHVINRDETDLHHCGQDLHMAYIATLSRIRTESNHNEGEELHASKSKKSEGVSPRAERTAQNSKRAEGLELGFETNCQLNAKWTPAKSEQSSQRSHMRQIVVSSKSFASDHACLQDARRTRPSAAVPSGPWNSNRRICMRSTPKGSQTCGPK